jgi:hypothetical protein
MSDRPRSVGPERTLKQELPDPYNKDFSKVLRGLNRRTPFGRRRLANDTVTASYLAAAVRLIQRQLGPEPDVPDDAECIPRPLLSFLSQRAVAAEVNHNPPPFHRRGRVSTLRERWKRQDSFSADVLRFSLWAEHFPASHQDEIADAQGEVLYGRDPVLGIHRTCYWDLTRLLATPMYRFGLIAAAESEADPVAAEAFSERYRVGGQLWKAFYARLLSVRGLRVRTGISLDDCVNILAAIADGLALRAIADPSVRIIDHDRRRSLLGIATLALVAGCLEPADGPAGAPLEQAVSSLITGQVTAPE